MQMELQQMQLAKEEKLKNEFLLKKQ